MVTVAIETVAIATVTIATVAIETITIATVAIATVTIATVAITNVTIAADSIATVAITTVDVATVVVETVPIANVATSTVAIATVTIATVTTATVVIETFDLVRVSLPKHVFNISKVCAPLNPFLTQNLMQTRCCKVDDIFFLWKIETTHKDRCTQYGVTSTNVKLSSWKSDRTSMTLLPTQQKKKNWNRPNESATRWRVLKLFDQGGIYMCMYVYILQHNRQEVQALWVHHSLKNFILSCWCSWTCTSPRFLAFFSGNRFFAV